MTTVDNFFESLSQQLVKQGAVSTAGQVIEFFRHQGAYHELFEALKMKARIELGLPAVPPGPDETLSPMLTDKLERALIDACRTVGLLLLGDGRIREGWMYMRPVGDRAAAAEALTAIEATSENLDELMEVLVHEGVDVERGYQLSLTRLGTCNSITLFDSTLAYKPKRDKQQAAALLVRHVHRELMNSLRIDIGRREGRPTLGETAEAILADHPTLLKDGTYHLDTTHLSSTVRIGRVVDDPILQKLCLDIAQYGRNLHPQYQYPGDEPFLEFYPNSIAFFRTLLGQHVEAGLRLFRQKAEALDPREHGTAAIETYIDLLSRIGRHEEAFKSFVKMMPDGIRPVGIAPSLLELSQRTGSYQPMLDHCQQKMDYLGFAAALLQSASALPASTTKVSSITG
jgi:hypothetical protein